jgi:hypothetical protein
MWWKGGGYLLLHWQRRIKYTAGQGTSVFNEPTNGATGSPATLRAGSSPPSKRPGKWLATIPMAAVIANKYQGSVSTARTMSWSNPTAGLILPIRSTGHPGRLSRGSNRLLASIRLRPTSDHAGGRQFRVSQRARLLAGRKLAVRQRFRRGELRAFDVLPNGLLADLVSDLRGGEPVGPAGMKVGRWRCPRGAVAPHNPGRFRGKPLRGPKALPGRPETVSTGEVSWGEICGRFRQARGQAAPVSVLPSTG